MTPLELFGPPRAWLTDIYRKRTTMLMLDAKPEQFRVDFKVWLEASYHIWLYFEYETDRVRSRGFKHFGARNIWEHIRYETKLAEGPGAEFKLNNNFCPDCARLYVLMHPEALGFFETRVLKKAARRQ